MSRINVNKLRGKIAENRTTVEALSEATHIGRTTMYRRFNEGGGGFTLNQVDAIAEALCLTYQEKCDIFFQ